MLSRYLKSVLLLCLFLGTGWVFAAPRDLYSFAHEEDTQRFQHLTQELRCVVCQNQSLNDSDATLAQDLRKKIYIQMNQGKSDAEIKQFLVSRYGQFILFSPPLAPATLFLWAFPAFLLVLALLVAGFKRR